jgi:hypothetical protein
MVSPLPAGDGHLDRFVGGRWWSVPAPKAGVNNSCQGEADLSNNKPPGQLPRVLTPGQVVSQSRNQGGTLPIRLGHAGVMWLGGEVVVKLDTEQLHLLGGADLDAIDRDTKAGDVPVVNIATNHGL